MQSRCLRTRAPARCSLLEYENGYLSLHVCSDPRNTRVRACDARGPLSHAARPRLFTFRCAQHPAGIHSATPASYVCWTDLDTVRTEHVARSSRTLAVSREGLLSGQCGQLVSMALCRGCTPLHIPRKQKMSRDRASQNLHLQLQEPHPRSV